MTKSSMRLIASRIPMMVAAAVLLSAAIALLAGHPDAWDPACMPGAPVHRRVDAAGPTPTLAPPPKTVVVKVEVDKPDLQVGWVESK